MIEGPVKVKLIAPQWQLPVYFFIKLNPWLIIFNNTKVSETSVTGKSGQTLTNGSSMN